MPDPSTPANDDSRSALWSREVRARLSSLRLSPTPETEIIDELSQHLDDRYRELRAAGASPEETTHVALADFRSGNVLAQHTRAVEPARVGQAAARHPAVALEAGTRAELEGRATRMCSAPRGW